MGRLVVNNAMTVNGAFEAPVPEPDGWLVLDADINQVALEQFLVADPGRRPDHGFLRRPDQQYAQVRRLPEPP